MFLDADAEFSEVVTTADRLSTPREVDPFDLPHETYAHVLVDEAQDITPMQWRMLRRRGAGASWTIVGDPAQSSWPDAAEAERAISEIIGTRTRPPVPDEHQLPQPGRGVRPGGAGRGHRLPAGRPAEGRPLHRHRARAAGRRVGRRRRVHDRPSSETLLDEVAGTVGVICPPSARTRRGRRLAAAELPGAERLALVTSLESKGLEYDGVLVVTPDEIVAESPGGVRSLYVALTRPTQRLVTLDAAPDADWRRSLG